MMRLHIAKEGLPFLAIPVILAILCLLFPQTRWQWPFWVCLVLALCVGMFFRDPERLIPQGENLVISPVRYPALGDETYLQVCIFMSVFNVHINRAPVAGVVENVSYHPGKFFAAFEPKASLLNEQNSTIFAHTLPNGATARILVKQIAGLIARRIVCYAKPGMSFARGERMGLIRFGSRVDLFLPADIDLAVKLNDVVTGGVTVIGTLQAKK